MKAKFYMFFLLIFCCHQLQVFGQFQSKSDTLQKKGPWLYLNQPISIIYKLNPQLGYRFSDRHAVVVGFTALYVKREGETLLSNDYKLTLNGNRLNAEYRYHFIPPSRFETYIYGNVMGGNLDYFSSREGLFFGVTMTDKFKGKYVGGGIGFGHQLFFRKEKNVILQFNYGYSYFHLYQVNSALVSKEEATKLLVSRYSFFPLELSIRFGFRL